MLRDGRRDAVPGADQLGHDRDVRGSEVRSLHLWSGVRGRWSRYTPRSIGCYLSPRGGVGGSGSGCGSGPTLRSATPFHHNRRYGCTATARRSASRLWPCLFLAIAAVRTHLFELIMIESALLGCVGVRLLGCCPCTCLRSGQQLASEAQLAITQNAGELVKALKGEHPRPALHTPNSLSPLHAAARPCFKVAPSVFRHSRAVRLESCFGRCCV